ncbi:MAG: translation elongation factor 4 [Candidatus Marinamargulisbacteria bacterium]
MEHIRNFCIIAHIDHGKSTLSDRLIELTNTVEQRDMKAQLLDTMDIERERGITIKMQAVRLNYIQNNVNYTLNLIDTPGHVDFTYEVSRSLAACEGALLLVDAAQGIEAQTIANFYLALENDLEIIPVINKIDLPAADADKVAMDIEQVFGIPAEDCIKCSAKSGIGVAGILDHIIEKIPAPTPKYQDDYLRALIFDAHYDSYRGVIAYVRIMNGTLKKGDKIQMMSTGRTFDVTDIGHFKPKMTTSNQLMNGNVGYVTSSMKQVDDAKIGDTITLAKAPATDGLLGYKEVNPMVFSGIYPVDTNDYEDLKVALEKLKLNDSSLTFDTESSKALGFGFRCGFLGLLHMEIIQERIEREFNIDIVLTAPSVTYKLTLTSGESIELDNPSDYPDVQTIQEIQEPYVGLSIIAPSQYTGAIMELIQEHRGIYKKTEIIDALRQSFIYEIPMNEIISNFFDKLKSRTQGYASMDYWIEDYRPTKLVKVNMMINGDPVDALSFIAHQSKARTIASKMAEKLKTLIPRQLYEVNVQGAIGGKIICRETIKALRKNVTAKCYGGDISRKRKLLEKQKAGKKKMKQLGSISVPKEAFLSALKLD